jgi:hypothetical protein
MADDDEGVLAWEAIEAATFEHGGLTYSIVPGQPGTTFSRNHPVVAARRELFKPFTPSYVHEETGAPRSQSAAGHRGARTR